MDTNEYSELQGQLLILKQIKNPSTYVKEAVSKLTQELTKYESNNEYLLQKEIAVRDLEAIKSKFTLLDIKYTICEKQNVNYVQQIPKITYNPEIKVVTHINAQNTNYTYKKPKSFIFENKEYNSFSPYETISYPIQDWKDVLFGVCNLMQEKHPHDINKILELAGRTRRYFSTSLYDLSSGEAKKVPRQIIHTNIYMESNYSANVHVKMCYMIIEKFGHKPDSLNFITVN